MVLLHLMTLFPGEIFEAQTCHFNFKPIPSELEGIRMGTEITRFRDVYCSSG